MKNKWMMLAPALLTLAIPVLAAVPIQAKSEDPAGGPTAENEVSQPGFSGQWVLNTGASDDPARAMRQQARTQGGGQWGGGRGGRRGGRGGGKMPDASDSSIQMQQRKARMQKGISRLDIFFAEPELNITDGLDVTRLMFTDGRETTIWTGQGEATATASRQDGTLTVRTKASQGGPERVRHFMLSENGNRLTVIEETKMPGHKEPSKITLVYDRAS